MASTVHHVYLLVCLVSVWSILWIPVSFLHRCVCECVCECACVRVCLSMCTCVLCINGWLLIKGLEMLSNFLCACHGVCTPYFSVSMCAHVSLMWFHVVLSTAKLYSDGSKLSCLSLLYLSSLCKIYMSIKDCIEKYTCIDERYTNIWE